VPWGTSIPILNFLRFRVTRPYGTVGQRDGKSRNTAYRTAASKHCCDNTTSDVDDDDADDDGDDAQLRHNAWSGCPTQERDARVDEHAQGLAVPTH